MFIKTISRNFSQITSFQVEQLHNRSLVKLSGEDIRSFLQGLITNDVNILYNKKVNSLFTFFLNSKGRILYDVLLLKKNDHEILLDCDLSIKNNLLRHLKIHRLRKKVDIEEVNSNLWAIFNDKFVNENLFKFDGTFCTKAYMDRHELDYEELKNNLQDENIYVFKDPRLHVLGYRVVSCPSIDVVKIMTDKGIDVNKTNDYIVFRYKLGVAEGVRELPLGNCFPLEANCDYLNGVSFHKGCYIGQELTARIHHTGTVRKRLMPLILSSSVPESECDRDLIITIGENKVGKLRGIYKTYGIALLRLTGVLENTSNLRISGISASTYKPFWWPQELNENRTTVLIS
ncbi:hypothetical protein PGB90_000931 [Kerria lacca]